MILKIITVVAFALAFHTASVRFGIEVSNALAIMGHGVGAGTIVGAVLGFYVASKLRK